MSVGVADISGIPLYNADLHTLGEPAAATKLKDQIGEADAVRIASPEYNFSISAALKNALDWVSRPPVPPFNGNAQRSWASLQAP